MIHTFMIFSLVKRRVLQGLNQVPGSAVFDCIFDFIQLFHLELRHQVSRR